MFSVCSIFRKIPWNRAGVVKTSRDWPKSAPYPRLKNSKKTSKCQVFSFTVLENRKFFEKNGPSGALKSHNAEKLKGRPFEVFQHPFCRKTWKNWRKQKFLFSEKISVPKKNWKGGSFGIFQHPVCRKTAKKLKGDPLGKKFSGKKSQCRKKIGRGDPLVSPGMVWYAGKQEKPFWFSSLDQIVQFGAIMFCRTFKNYFGQFVWIEKKRKATIIVAFHFMKRRLKMTESAFLP